MSEQQEARVILAMAAEADDRFTWDWIRMIQPEMFHAPVAVKFAYFGAEGEAATRPYVSTRWVTTADDMTDLMDHGRAGCVCGCYALTGDVLEAALQETREGPVQAVVIIADRFRGDLDKAIALAKQLGAAGTRLFMVQQGGRAGDSNEAAFRTLAEASGGAYERYNPHNERVVERLPGMFKAISHFAAGGMAALEAQDDESSNRLLEQMAPALIR